MKLNLIILLIFHFFIFSTCLQVFFRRNRFTAEDMTCTVSSHADIFVGLYIVVTCSCAEAECLIFHKVKVEVSFMWVHYKTLSQNMDPHSSEHIRNNIESSQNKN